MTVTPGACPVSVVVLALLVLFAVPANGQSRTGYQPDTLSGLGPCDTARVLPYFNVRGKYPLSSEALARGADSALHTRDTSATGYVTFQLLIDCGGKLRRHRMLQTDAAYRPAGFPEPIVAELFGFVAGLSAWPEARYEGRPVNYRGYLSFKLNHGHVVAVSP